MNEKYNLTASLFGDLAYEIKHLKFNAFYKNYQQAIQLAKLILKRFGYYIHTTQSKKTIATPPFWVDMSKLFELYVLKLLKQQFGSKIKYHPGTYGTMVMNWIIFMLMVWIQW